MADSADQVVLGHFRFGDGEDFDRVGVVVGAEEQGVGGRFDVCYGASIVFQNSVHIELRFAIWLE